MLYLSHPKFENVSRIALGTGSLAGDHGGYAFGGKEVESVERVVKVAEEVGITVVDTAPMYGFHFVEIELGKHLPKNKFKLITKGGVAFSQKKNVRIDNSPSMLGSMLHESLKNLQTESIDYYFIHWPDPNVALEESVNFLVKQKKIGKIKNIGLSNHVIADISADILKEISLTQNEVNLVESKIPSLETKTQHDLLVTGFGLLGKGVLVKKEFPQFETLDYRARPEAKAKLVHKFEKFQAAQYSTNPNDVIKNTFQQFPALDIAVIGFRNSEQVRGICENF